MSNIVRSVLLPPYLEDSEAWEALTVAVDAVFGSTIDDPTHWLSRLRDTWILQEATELRLADQSSIIASSDFEDIEKNILVRQANMLGFDLTNSDVLSTEDYQRLVRNLAKYWYSKGTPQVQNFLGYVLDSILTLTNLWSTVGPNGPDTYGEFLPEGDPGIGAAVWEGGQWFPSTHIEATFDPFKFDGLTMPKLIALFYSIANYNLVLYRIILEGSLHIHSVDETELARIVVVVPWCEIEYTIETV